MTNGVSHLPKFSRRRRQRGSLNFVLPRGKGVKWLFKPRVHNPHHPPSYDTVGIIFHQLRMDQLNPLAMTSQHLPVLGYHVHTPPSQHPFFDNPAILKRIFKDLEPHSLFHTALTCTNFKDLALDLLWNSLDSLLPLLSLLRPFKLINKTYVRNTRVSFDIANVICYCRCFKDHSTRENGPSLILMLDG